jgi:3-hydroxyacyl-CoA dehydrogenase/3-hydroxy-2-methylbutyryl-CoA dehydrogenase
MLGRMLCLTFLLSSSGLGLATVHDLLTSNAYISIVDRLPPPSNTRLPTEHVKFFQTDVTKLDEIERAVDGTIAWTKETGMVLGGVINCAGVGTAAKVKSTLCSLRHSVLTNK